MLKKQRKAAIAVKNLLSAMNRDDSDFEDCNESSGEEFRLRKSDIDCSSSSQSSEDELSP